jgi:hypothetical protein
VDISDFDRPGFRPVIVGRVENEHLEVAKFRALLRGPMLLQPEQPGLAQLLQPVALADGRRQLLSSTAQRLIQAAPRTGEEFRERQLNWRRRSRPDREHINKIEEYRAARSQAGSDTITKILYTLRRGTCLFFHLSSIALERASGEASPPLFCPNS